MRPILAKQTAPSRFVLLEGGIVGRADDMMIIRGMNVYPTAIEQILHSFPEVVEYRMTARKHGAMDELVIEVEDHLQQPARIAQELQLKLGLKIDVRCVAALSLPRSEGKGRRFVDERTVSTRGRQGDEETTAEDVERNNSPCLPLSLSSLSSTITL